MATHTPGPWHGADKRQRDATYAICQSGYRVASVHLRDVNVPPFEHDAEQAANARLIAAAPELLDVVRTVAEFAAVARLETPLAVQARDLLARIEGDQ